MVQTVCTDLAGRLLPTTPLEPCPHPRKLRIGEPLPYHKQDWPGLPDRARLPNGYQRSDSLPVATTQGPAILQTYDFGDTPRAFDQLDPGDGGQLIVFTPSTAAVGVTEDGGAGLQLFLGPACTPLDSWILVDRTFPAPGQTVAALTRRPDRCAHPNHAFTTWSLRPVPFRYTVRGQPGAATWTTLVTDHYDDADPTRSRAMERLYFTQPLGYTRWEAWQNPAQRPGATAVAATLAATARCPPAVPGPAGWAMVDCREWTQLVPAASPAGDPPFVWLDRLRTAPATAALFGPTPPR